ncbi:MAG TPA: DUF1573 domain-containing protein [Chitinophagaceae bacterium]|nr:DUF1573 domain-containing protein [Chitinophagaceae bacterium]
MKKLTAFILFICIAWVAIAQTSTNANTTSNANATTPADNLNIKETEHDFGKIPQGKPVFYFFEIANTGTTPLKLDNVQASCGCTTPEWNHEAIPAGGTDKIKVGYNAAAEGNFEKFITITYNGTQTKQIKIRGTVWKAPVGSAPANASVQILKQQNN